MTVTPYWLTGIHPMPVRDLAMQVDDLLTREGFVKDYLYLPVTDGEPSGYCVAGAVNKILTGSWSYPRKYDLSPADPAYTHGPMHDFALEFRAVASSEFPALWASAVSRVVQTTYDAPLPVLNMISFNNLPDVTLADMRRILMLMR